MHVSVQVCAVCSSRRWLGRIGGGGGGMQTGGCGINGRGMGVDGGGVGGAGGGEGDRGGGGPEFGRYRDGKGERINRGGKGGQGGKGGSRGVGDADEGGNGGRGNEGDVMRLLPAEVLEVLVRLGTTPAWACCARRWWSCTACIPAARARRVSSVETTTPGWSGGHVPHATGQLVRAKELESHAEGCAEK